ncbi:helix-turn-helix domain-containing protein [Flavisolibacter ginsenosidimutans]|uniref:Helix-turn-helix domain-containing protein n=1 Tax=Flavisolibacter ginsenosidimutans TaxID=661481 RepID=A0A5B8UPT2_9BACT|nr:helix-turn-helix domain-containing protein [Flavisolibacter ginsenosidimutans]QEC58382.1 helix-turn-helix domain-containing protein [Flavisolibacter ginsenosidimutans]
MDKNNSTPILIPLEPSEFWTQMRGIIREELSKQTKENKGEECFQVTGLTYKPLFKIQEVCSFFQVSRPTIYDWIKQGKLTPYKIRSRVYFLFNDIQKLLEPGR